MRPVLIAVAAMLGAVIAIGSVWNRNPPQNPRPAPDGKIPRRTPETERTLEVLDARTKGSYGYDVWRETACNGVTLFYHPDAKDGDVAWYWFDLQTGQLTEYVT